MLVTWFVANRIGLELGDMAALGPEWWAPQWPLFALSCLAMLGMNFAAGLIWGRMVHDMGGPELAPIDAIRVIILANVGRYVPGKVWQVAGLVVLAKRVGVPGTVATGAAVLGHGLSLGAATLVGGAAFAGATVEGRIKGWILLVAVALALTAMLTPPLFRRAASLWARLAKLDGGAQLLSARHVALWILLFVLMWVGYGTCFVILAASFGVVGTPLTVGPAFVAAYVVGYIALFAPAGIGVREVALAALLTPTVGVPTAAGLAVVARLWATAVELVPAAVFLSKEVSSTRGRREGAVGQ